MSVCLMIIEENNNNKPDTNRSGSIVLLLFQTQTLTAKCWNNLHVWSIIMIMKTINVTKKQNIIKRDVEKIYN